MKVTQSCPTLCNSMVHGVLQARILEWIAFSFSRGSSQPRDQTQVSHTVGRFFISWDTREAQEHWSGLPFPSPGDLPNPEIEPRSPTFQADSLPAEPQGKPKNTGVGSLSLLQWNFLTQESNWVLLHCRRILYQLSYDLLCACLKLCICGNAQLSASFYDGNLRMLRLVNSLHS